MVDCNLDIAYPIGKIRPASDLPCKNVIKCLSDFESGHLPTHKLKRLGEHCASEQIDKFQEVRFNGLSLPYECDICSIAWHPKDPEILGVGFRSGDLYIFNVKNPTPLAIYSDNGPYDRITGICFDDSRGKYCYVSHEYGGVKQKAYYRSESSESQILLSNRESLITCLTISQNTGLLVVGDSSGRVLLFDRDMGLVSKYSLHTNMINTVDFSYQFGWLFATSSLDNTVRLWDIRKIKSSVPVALLDHERRVISAYFSKTVSSRLLTTDPYQDNRLFSGPLWDLERTVVCPPRAKARHRVRTEGRWHPFVEAYIVGRYPIDFISGNTGKMLTQLYSPECPFSVSVNVFNCNGTALAAGVRQNLMIWRTPVNKM